MDFSIKKTMHVTVDTPYRKNFEEFTSHGCCRKHRRFETTQQRSMGVVSIVGDYTSKTERGCVYAGDMVPCMAPYHCNSHCHSHYLVVFRCTHVEPNGHCCSGVIFSNHICNAHTIQWHRAEEQRLQEDTTTKDPSDREEQCLQEDTTVDMRAGAGNDNMAMLVADRNLHFGTTQDVLVRNEFMESGETQHMVLSPGGAKDDYQVPPVCIAYHIAGWCPVGESCEFLHLDRISCTLLRLQQHKRALIRPPK
jgi:Zinc finger C-x8-C-x5-C-x3-H type (and similar)